MGDIQITDTTTGKLVAAEDAELETPGPGPGLQLSGGSVVTHPALVLAGKGSIQLSNWQSVVTNPTVVPLASHTTDIVKFQYRVVNRGSDDAILFMNMQPAGSADSGTVVYLIEPLKNVATSGTFSSGAQTAGAGPYILRIGASEKSSVVIDNIAIYRHDAIQTTSPPPAWSRLAFSDVLASMSATIQTGPPADSPAFIRRLRNLNPNMVILPIMESQAVATATHPNGGNVCLDCQFLSGMADEWRLRHSNRQYVMDHDVDDNHNGIRDETPALAVPYGPADGRDGMRKNTGLVKRTRELLGPDGNIMLDCWMALTEQYTIEFAEMVAPYRVYWMEECLPPHDFEGFEKPGDRNPGTTRGQTERFPVFADQKPGNVPSVTGFCTLHSAYG